ncbi:hypothetical protein ACTVCO_06080 [Sanguibacter sp. A247]|uniref:hypothetical protein n=1 Tax=unclassified Sanguibacter TaxID=2645534 RepID=UPI003FD8876C
MPVDLLRRPGVAMPGPGRTTLLAVAGLLVVEAAVLVVGGGAAVVDLVRGGRVGVDLFLAAFAWGLAAFLVVAARGLLDGRRWARSPAITWQLFQIVIAVTWLQGEVSLSPIILLAASVGVIVGLLLPSVVRRTLTGRETES